MSSSKFENLILQSNVSSIDNLVSKQLKKISTKYGLDVKAVTEAFNTGISEAVNQANKEEKSKPTKSEKSKKNNNKKQCIEIIKNKGTQCQSKVSDKSETGNYCGRHLGREKSEGESKEKKKSGNKKPTKKELLKEQNTEVIKKLNDSKQKLSVARNQYGNFEHPETHFVFNRDTSEVIGKQVGSEVKPLTAADIEVCKEKNFKFRMPDNIIRSGGKKDENSESEEDSDTQKMSKMPKNMSRQMRNTDLGMEDSDDGDDSD